MGSRKNCTYAGEQETWLPGAANILCSLHNVQVCDKERRDMLIAQNVAHNNSLCFYTVGHILACNGGEYKEGKGRRCARKSRPPKVSNFPPKLPCLSKRPHKSVATPHCLPFKWIISHVCARRFHFVQANHYHTIVLKNDHQ